MASLQVRELPENIYSLLKRRAEAEHRSIAQEAIVLLAKGLDTSIAPKERRARLLPFKRFNAWVLGGNSPRSMMILLSAFSADCEAW